MGLIKHQSTKFKIFTQDGSLGWTAENVLKEQNIVKTKFTNSKFGQKIRSVLYVGNPHYGNYALYLQAVWSIVILGLVTYFKNLGRHHILNSTCRLYYLASFYICQYSKRVEVAT